MNSGEDSAFPMVSSSSSASHKYDLSVSMSTDSSWKSAAAWAHLEPQCGVNTCVKVHEKICGVRVFCSHLPSVTVAINGKRNQL